jgi:cobalt-zinc-cadmium efflux system outer membrane protein
MHRLPLVVAIALLGSVHAWSQSVTEAVIDPVNGLTATELVRLGIRQNDTILSGEQEIAAAQGGLLQAGLRANPTLDTRGMREIGGPMNSFMVGGSLPLELFHRRARRTDVAEEAVRAATFQQAERERQIRSAVESGFGDVLAVRRNVQFTNELLKVNRHALRLTEARVTQGATPALDADLLRVEVNRIDALKIDLETQLEIRLLELKSLIGLSPDEPLRLRGALEADASTVSEDEAVSRALATRPDLLWARALVQQAAAKVKQAETEGRPDATVSASYERRDQGFGLNGLTPAGQLQRIQGIFHLATVGLSISLPVRNRNQGAVAAAIAQKEAAERTREYAELIAKREVAAAFLAQRTAGESLDIYRQGVRDQARQNLAVVRRAYELGRNQLLDVIAEQRRLIDVEMGYTEALNRQYQAAVQLRAAANLD